VHDKLEGDFVLPLLQLHFVHKVAENQEQFDVTRSMLRQRQRLDFDLHAVLVLQIDIGKLLSFVFDVHSSLLIWKFRRNFEPNFVEVRQSSRAKSPLRIGQIPSFMHESNSSPHAKLSESEKIEHKITLYGNESTEK
jgi:hypothetical protein